MCAWIYDRLFYNISKEWYRKILKGIDINTSYLKSCQEKIDEIEVGHQIKLRHQSVYDLAPTDRYDAIYFSASFMLLPNQEEALKVAQQSLTESGRVCFTQTFETKRTQFWEIIKPLLIFFTAVHL
jgi:ubiquinone/menaquinone biosynthesis C-methylase UbiE